MLKNYFKYNYNSKKFFFKKSSYLFFCAFVQNYEVFLALSCYNLDQKKFKMYEISLKKDKIKKSKYWLYNKNLKKMILYIKKNLAKKNNFYKKRKLETFSVYSNKLLVFFYILYFYNSLFFEYKLFNLDLRIDSNSIFFYYVYYKNNLKKIGINLNKINFNYLSHISTKVYLYFYVYLYFIYYGMSTGRSEKNFFFYITWEEFYLFFIFIQKRKYLFLYKVSYRSQFAKKKYLKKFFKKPKKR